MRRMNLIKTLRSLTIQKLFL